MEPIVEGDAERGSHLDEVNARATQERVGEYNLQRIVSMSVLGEQEAINMTHGSLPAGHAINPPMGHTVEVRASRERNCPRDETRLRQCTGIRQFD